MGKRDLRLTPTKEMWIALNKIVANREEAYNFPVCLEGLRFFLIAEGVMTDKLILSQARRGLISERELTHLREHGLTSVEMPRVKTQYELHEDKIKAQKHDRWVNTFTQTFENWKRMKKKSVYRHLLKAQELSAMSEAKRLLNLMKENTELELIFTQKGENIETEGVPQFV